MKHDYKMVQMAPAVVAEHGKKAKNKGQEAAAYLQSIVKEHAVDGWEFFRIDSFIIDSQPGCLASLSGAKSESSQYYVVTFRKELE